MKSLDKVLVVVGIALLAYAIFSRFYGAPSLAMSSFKSSNVLVLANTAFLLAIVLKDWSK